VFTICKNRWYSDFLSRQWGLRASKSDTRIKTFRHYLDIGGQAETRINQAGPGYLHLRRAKAALMSEDPR